LLHWTDDDGIPHSEFTTSLTACLTTLVRSGLWAEQFDLPLCNKETRPRWRQFVKTSIILCGNDGRLPFGGADALDVRPWLAAAARQAKLSPASRAVRLLAGLQKSGKR